MERWLLICLKEGLYSLTTQFCMFYNAKKMLRVKRSLIPLYVISIIKAIYIHLWTRSQAPHTSNVVIVTTSTITIWLTLAAIIVYLVSFSGSFAKRALSIVLIEFYMVILSMPVLMVVNFIEGNPDLLSLDVPITWLDILNPILIIGVNQLLGIWLFPLMNQYREHEVKHQKIITIAAVFYFVSQQVSGVYSLYQNSVDRALQTTQLVLPAMLVVGIYFWFRYYSKISKERTAHLLRQVTSIAGRYAAIREERSELQQRLEAVEKQMAQIESSLQQGILPKEAEIRQYISELKEEYHVLSRGLYCTDPQIDAVLFCEAEKMANKGIPCEIHFENYLSREAVEDEDIAIMLFLICEEALHGRPGQVSLSCSMLVGQLAIAFAMPSGKRTKKRWRELRGVIRKYHGTIEQMTEEAAGSPAGETSWLIKIPVDG